MSVTIKSVFNVLMVYSAFGTCSLYSRMSLHQSVSQLEQKQQKERESKFSISLQKFFFIREYLLDRDSIPKLCYNHGTYIR